MNVQILCAITQWLKINKDFLLISVDTDCGAAGSLNSFFLMKKYWISKATDKSSRVHNITSLINASNLQSYAMIAPQNVKESVESASHLLNSLVSVFMYNNFILFLFLKF